MRNSSIARRYASAIFGAAKKVNKVDVILSDITLIEEAFVKYDDLREALHSPVVTDNKKKAIISDIFKDKVDELTLNFFFLVIDKRREGIISLLKDEIEALVFEEKNISIVVIESVIPLKSEQVEAIKTKLENIFKRTLIVKENIINEELIGGVKVILGDKIIDGSIKAKLSLIKDTLMA